MATETEVREALAYIDPAQTTYEEWLNVGMAIKADGLPCSLWDEWSRRDPMRYDGKCWAKWESLQSSGITIKTLFKMAIDRGYSSGSGGGNLGNREIGESEIISAADLYKVIDEHDVSISLIPQCPVKWDQIADIRKYLSAIYDTDDHVSYCTKSYQTEDGKWHPQERNYDRTAGRLLGELGKAKRIEDVFMDYNHECGAWITANPVDGVGGSDANVTAFRYALIESDTQDVNVQYSLMMELKLPIAALVHSGNKSIHAIVHVDAADKREYRDRVLKLIDICRKNGLEVDKSAKNASRLSRMPGFWRGEKPQYLIGTNLGMESWDAWIEYIESINDDLPEITDFSEIAKDLPPLAPELIDGVLRKGHKMLIAGGSKTGKSMLSAQLCISIATGGSWLGRKCAKGKVLYINLEIDGASLYRRFDSACRGRGIDSVESLGHNLYIWNLRGNAMQLDKLVPIIIRRCKDLGLSAIVLDPVYKVMIGDENKAGDMTNFCNQFDKIASTLGASAIYIHHFSKGDQDKKQAIDRSSGSGVFGRDPDAICTVTKIQADEPAVRVEFTVREFPELDPIDAWYRYPIHVVDDTGELKGKKLIGGSQKKSKEDKLTEFVDQLHCAYEYLAYDENGNPKEVTQPDICKWMKMERRAFARNLSEAIASEMTCLRKKNEDKKTGKAAVIYKPDEVGAQGCANAHL